MKIKKTIIVIITIIFMIVSLNIMFKGFSMYKEAVKEKKKKKRIKK